MEVQRIGIQEEYGYRHWVWEFNGSAEALQAYWDKKIVPALKNHGCLFHPSKLEGKVHEVNIFMHTDSISTPHCWSKFIKDTDNQLTHESHLHEHRDSYLSVLK
jgi:hypothetical protein